MQHVPQDTQMGSLARRASERFAWHWETVKIAGKDRELAVASDPNGMLIDACQRQDAGEVDVVDPFWATTWRAASGMDRYLDRLDLRGRRVLELGCGTGHAGLAAAHRGGQVVLTDALSDPLLLVRMSTLRIQDRCQIQRLRFGIDEIEGEKFPLILGSDVTYLRQLWPDLEMCWRQHLAKDGQILLSDPHRNIANEFRQWISERPWEYSEHKITLEDDPDHPIRIMQLSAKR